MQYLSLIVCIVGGLAFVFLPDSPDTKVKRLGELGKWAFVVGLVFVVWLFGK